MAINRKTIEAINSQTIQRYNERLAQRGPGAYALGWGEEQYQRKRFFDALHALETDDIEGKVVLDIGCGLGDFYSFLLSQGLTPKGYVGIDINERFLALAQNRYPECRFEHRDLFLSPFEKPAAHAGLMLGVINFRLENHEEYAQQMIRLAFDAVSEVLVVNAISDIHNDDYPRENFIYYFKPDEWLKFAQTLTPFCSLIHDYRGMPQHEFMLVMRKAPYSNAGQNHAND